MTTVLAEEIPRITPRAIRELKQKEVDLVIVDVRKVESFNDHRVPGAISIPKVVLHQRYVVLNPEQDIVFY